MTVKVRQLKRLKLLDSYMVNVQNRFDQFQSEGIMLILLRQAEWVLTKNRSMTACSLLHCFRTWKAQLFRVVGWYFRVFFFFFHPFLTRHLVIFLPPVHTFGIPLDPLNEGHIAGSAKHCKWETRRVTKEIVGESEAANGLELWAFTAEFWWQTSGEGIRRPEQRKFLLSGC